MQFLAKKAALGEPLIHTAAAIHARTHVMNVGRELKKMKESGAWDMLVQITKEALPSAATGADSAATGAAPAPANVTEPAAPLTPIGVVIERAPKRPGDGVAYGKHGTRGAWREGLKTMSLRVADGAVSPTSGVAQLAEAGVTLTKRTLKDHAKKAPGKSPELAGARPWLPHEMQQDLYDDICMLRAHNFPCTMQTVLTTARALVRGTALESKWEDYDEMLTEHWYRDFCKSWDLSPADLKPLDDVRSAWETSANADKQYEIWADLALSTKPPCAVRNPDFNPEKPYDQPIFWTADGLDRLSGMDETDVRGEQSKRNRAPEARSVTVNEFGSLSGGGRGRGRGGNRGGRGKKKAKSPNAEAPESVKVDDKAVVTLKGGSKMSWAGASKGNGESLAPMCISNKGLTEDMLKHAPRGTVIDHREDPPAPMRAQYAITKSGGMEWEANVAYLEQIVQPATRSKKGEREGIHGVDGFGSHINIKVIRKAVELGQHIALRFPHGSRKIQGQDTDNFPLFARRFEKAKSEKQVAKFQAARAFAAKQEPPRNPTAQEIYDASTLTEEEWLECAVKPWEEAFDPEVNRRAWKHESIVPFTRKVYWDLRQQEEAQKKEVAPVSYSESFFSAFGYTKEQAAAIKNSTSAGSSSADALVTRTEDEDVDLSSEGMNADAEAALEAEQQSDAPAKKKPRVSSGDLFKLKGSATGKMALEILRQKEVERRTALLKKEANKDKKETKNAEQRRTDLLASNQLLLDIAESDNPKDRLNRTNKPELTSLLRIHGIQPPQGKNWQSWGKPDVLSAVRDLLQRDFVGTAEQRPQLIAAAQVTLALTMVPAGEGEVPGSS
jgi:hypothetical protein